MASRVSELVVEAADVSPTDDGQDAEPARLLALGAAPVDAGRSGGGRYVLADPEGNGFCLLPVRIPPVRAR
ncbi:VOC family protein [Streptomyces caatingaensis]|uniref:Glyoxalase/bleomycin resistance protein/dioxygenase n=1 Tax=Streptomyces caatingaensis TaxID=1678637 RepID=A0A0K9XIU9_9ACTN|nr:VOC family protein [Streptomyces caatingaensis]KNB53213.1 glyoxalase/bleomycin resistance protein/dioxygenase [Streptomyces caatingaensis]